MGLIVMDIERQFEVEVTHVNRFESFRCRITWGSTTDPGETTIEVSGCGHGEAVLTPSNKGLFCLSYIYIIYTL